MPVRGNADAVRRRGLQLGRLNALERLGLAEEVGPGRWRVDADLAPCLQELSRRGDVIRTMHARAWGIESICIHVKFGPAHLAGVTKSSLNPATVDLFVTM